MRRRADALWPMFDADFKAVWAEVEFMDGARGWFRVGELHQLENIRRILATAVKL